MVLGNNIRERRLECYRMYKRIWTHRRTTPFPFELDGVRNGGGLSPFQSICVFFFALIQKVSVSVYPQIYLHFYCSRAPSLPDPSSSPSRYFLFQEKEGETLWSMHCLRISSVDWCSRWRRQWDFYIRCGEFDGFGGKLGSHFSFAVAK